MDYAAFFDSSWRLVTSISVLLLVVLLLLLLRIVHLRARLIERTAREHRFLEVWRPLLAAAVAGETDELPALAAGEEIFFMEQWLHLQESLRGPAKRRLNIIALRSGMLRHAYSLLHKNDLRLQLLALLVLGYLRDPQGRNDVLGFAHHRDPLLSLIAARALFQIDANSAVRDLGQSLLEREDWPTPQLATILRETGRESMFSMLADMALYLADATDGVRLNRLRRLLRLLEIAPWQGAIPAVRSILSVTRDDEIVAQCLKLLRDPEDLALVRRYFDHASWVVRLQAIRALGQIGTMDDLPLLQVALSDPSWWVRYRAAQSVLLMLRGKPGVLQDLQSRLTNDDARSMLEMAIEEREMQ